MDKDSDASRGEPTTPLGDKVADKAASTEEMRHADAMLDTTASSNRPIDRYNDQFAVPEPHAREQAPKIRLLSGVFLVIVALSAGFLGGWLGAGRDADDALASNSTQQQVVSSESQLISSIAKNVEPSVVSVDVTSQSDSQPNYFGIGGGNAEQQSAGTGIIISSNGLIVTNRHVVPQGTTKVSVTLSDGTKLDNVQVIGRTRESDTLDVAFLKINDTKGKKLTAAKIGDSSKIQVGDKVVAIGNALGQFQNTVTSGIISGYGRSVQAGDSSGSSVESLQDLFQTDAAINEGNSGGPLVNTSGEVIGINTAIAGNAQGIGFAIPIGNIGGLIKTVLSTGKFEQPYLGVRYLPLTNDTASQLDLKVTRGAYILPEDKTGGQPSIIDGSPADKAGLKPGDIIVAVNGKNVNERNSLTALLDQHQVGDTVTLKVNRDNKSQDIKVKLAAEPVDPSTSEQQ